MSLRAQFLACEQYAEGHGWQVAARYHDATAAGRSDRPQYQAMLAEGCRMSQSSKHVVITVAALTRLGETNWPINCFGMY